MRLLPMLLITASLLAAGCGEDEERSAGGAQARASAMKGEGDDAALPPRSDEDAKKKRGSKATARRMSGTTVTVGDSDFGRMLFDSNEQAIYIFRERPEGQERLLRRVRGGLAARLH